MKNYSVIIPHHNCPELLKRLINSIPLREDIQIIIVDDASDTPLKESSFKGRDIEIYYISKKDTKWAGHARNIGLEKAEGKWILIPDADDFYVEDAFSILDKHIDSNVDCIYFNIQAENSNPASLKRVRRIRNIFSSYSEDNVESIETIKYRIHGPWVRMINKTFYDKYKFQFEEVIKGNDTSFAFQVGYFSKKIIIERNPIYVFSHTEGSVTFSSWDNMKAIRSFETYYLYNCFYDFIGRPKWKRKFIDFLIHFIYDLLRKRGFVGAMYSICYIMLHKKKITKDKNRYVNTIKNMQIASK